MRQQGWSRRLRFIKYTIRFGVCCYTYVSLDWTSDREHCPTVCAYLSSSFTWWRLFLVRGHLLLLHFGCHCPYLHVSGSTPEDIALPKEVFTRKIIRCDGKEYKVQNPFGNCSQQLISILKCLQGKTRWCFTGGMSSLIGRNLGLYILNIATGAHLPERLPCLTWMQITKITHNTGHETKYNYI